MAGGGYGYDLNCACCGCEGDDATCDEEECVPYGSVEDCGGCEFTPTEFSIDMGATECVDCCENASGEQTVTYDAGCVWVSDTFDCDGDTYRWELNLNSTPTLSLERTAGSGDLIEIVYEKATSWECLCDNLMTLVSYENCSGMKTSVCVVPQADIFDTSCVPCGTIAQCWEIVVAGVANNGDCTGCAAISGTYVITLGVPDAGICAGTVSLLGNLCTAGGSGLSNTISIIFDAINGVRVLIYDRTATLTVLYKLFSLDCNGPNIVPSPGATNIHCAWPATVLIRPVDCP